MAWESRGQKRYYYRVQKANGRVRKLYLGAGDLARQAAAHDEARKARRAADQAELAELQTSLTTVEQIAAEVQHGVDLLTEATLLALGYQERRGEWRRRRHET